MNAALVQQPINDAFYLASIKLNAVSSVADFSAVSSYFHRTAAIKMDWSLSETEPATWAVDLRQTVFSQEARLISINPHAALTWIVGGFYSDARKREADSGNPSLGPAYGENATAIRQAQLEWFGQIGLRMAKGLTARVGLRVGRTSYASETEAAPIVRNGGAETAMTPRFDLSYRTDVGNLFYLTAAKGYRSGGVYAAVTFCGEGPVPFPADTLWSYEIGAKGDLLGGRLHMEPSMFHMKWNNKQPGPIIGGCNIGSLGATAVSDGFDLAMQALVVEHFKLGLAIAYTDAHYTQPLKLGDAVILHEGDAHSGQRRCAGHPGESNR